MPIAFDFSLWLKHSRLLATLANVDQLAVSQLGDDADLMTRQFSDIESLVDVELLDGETWVALSTGQIVHETFRHPLYSNGTWSAGIVVESDRSATPEQLQALCFVLNEWLITA